jgi:hypothetical protein
MITIAFLEGHFPPCPTKVNTWVTAQYLVGKSCVPVGLRTMAAEVPNDCLWLSSFNAFSVGHH